MIEHGFFVMGLSLLLVHELDAVRLREWRMFVILKDFGDDQAPLAFTALHVPLYLLLFLGLFGAATPNAVLITVLSAFFVVHSLLHVLFTRHPRNEFRSAFSWFLILGAGVCGGLELLLQAR